MYLYGSKKLIKFLGKPAWASGDSPASDDYWFGNLFYLNRRKCLIFIHSLTRYSVVLTDILKADVRELPEMIIDQMAYQFEVDGIASGRRLAMQLVHPVTLISPCPDKALIGTAVQHVKELEWHVVMEEGGIQDDEFKRRIPLLNEIPILIRRDDKKMYTDPQQEMRKLAGTL